MKEMTEKEIAHEIMNDLTNLIISSVGIMSLSLEEDKIGDAIASVHVLHTMINAGLNQCAMLADPAVQEGLMAGELLERQILSTAEAEMRRN